MRIRNFSESKEILQNSKILIKDPLEYKGKFKELFGNDNLINLEIGMGKGDFLLQIAQDNPDMNYIGIEKYDTIVARALQKIEQLELPNLKIIRMDASNIKEVFDKEINILYLNHSDPWPKDRHEKRRLTSKNFLTNYDYIFKDKKTIIMKTDNTDLFDYSVLSLENYGYNINFKTYDLDKTNVKSYPTEYTKKFIAKGFKIKYLEASKNS